MHPHLTNELARVRDEEMERRVARPALVAVGNRNGLVATGVAYLRLGRWTVGPHRVSTCNN